jgi:hypothetical protein
MWLVAFLFATLTVSTTKNTSNSLFHQPKVVVLTPKCVSPAFLVDVVQKDSMLCIVISVCPAVVFVVAMTPCPLLHHPDMPLDTPASLGWLMWLVAFLFATPKVSTTKNTSNSLFTNAKVVVLTPKCVSPAFLVVLFGRLAYFVLSLLLAAVIMIVPICCCHCCCRCRCHDLLPPAALPHMPLEMPASLGQLMWLVAFLFAMKTKMMMVWVWMVL